VAEKSPARTRTYASPGPPHLRRQVSGPLQASASGKFWAVRAVGAGCRGGYLASAETQVKPR